MKRFTVVLVTLALVGFAVTAFAEVTSETVEWTPPPDCGAPYVESMEECSLCHLADPPEAISATSATESAEANSLTYKTIVSSDQRIIAEIPAETVQPDQKFNHFVSVAPYIMTYQYGYAYGSTFHTLDYKWPWGSTDLNYSYADTSFSVPGEYKFEVRIIYCSSGAKVCAHGWVKTTLKWTVAVGDDVCVATAVPHLRQCDPQWCSNQYDDIDRTICQKGCALTSANMVVRRYGINVGADGTFADPGNLNSFLKTYEVCDKDKKNCETGYTNRGNIKWWFVDYYTKPSLAGTDKPTLKYQYYDVYDASTNESVYCSYQSSPTGTDNCAVLNRRVNEALCEGVPVILKVRGAGQGGERREHFLIAEGQTAVGGTETLSILDPYWDGTSDCSSSEPPAQREKYSLLYNDYYNNTFKGIRLYKPAEGADFSKIIVYMESPAHILAVDQWGNRTGYDVASGTVLREIPNSNYVNEAVESDEPFWVFYLGQPTDGLYKFEVMGYDYGEFTLGMEGYDSGNEANLLSLYHGLASPGRNYVYSVNYTADPSRVSTATPDTYLFGSFVPPLSTETVSVFKLNRTVPVKFYVTRSDGESHNDITARMSLQKIDSSIPIGDPIEPEASGAANEDNYFRYDPLADQYIYNLSTKNLTTGTWELTVVLDDGSTHTASIGLK